MARRSVCAGMGRRISGSANGPFTVIAMYNANGRASVCIPDPSLAPTLKELVDTAVSFRGVCVPNIDPKERIIKNDFSHIFTNMSGADGRSGVR